MSTEEAQFVGTKVFVACARILCGLKAKLISQAFKREKLAVQKVSDNT